MVDSYRLFEMAKKAYFGERDAKEVEKANNIFEEMLLAREKLEEDYKYRSKKDIIGLYEQEISESQLDVDMICEQNMFLSYRLSEYLQSLDYSSGRTLEFSNNAPFSMPDDLFKNDCR